MRRALLAVLPLLALARHTPTPEPVVVDRALVEHLRTLEDWAGTLESFDGDSFPAHAQRESAAPEVRERALAVAAPLYAELDALWSDPVSRLRLQSGRLWRDEPARLLGARVCVNLLVARAIHEARDLGDRAGCERDLELALAYSHSLGLDGVGVMVGWAGEGIVRGALEHLACAADGPDARIGAELGTLSVPWELERVLPGAREQYERQSSSAREWLASAAR